MVSRDRTAKIFDVATGGSQLTLSGHTGPVFGVAFSHDGKRLATASWDGTARIWDATSGKELITLSGNLSPVNAVAFSNDDKHMIAARHDSTLQVYVLESEELKALARTRLTRDLSADECRRYLHVDICPSVP